MKKILFNLFSVIFLALVLSSCGKSDKTDTTSTTTDKDKKTESTSTTTTSTGGNGAYHIAYDMGGKTMTGTIDTWVKDSKFRQTMNGDVIGKKMVSNTYGDGTFVYMITEVMGQKMGMKTDASKYKKQNDNSGQTNLDYGHFEDFLKDKKSLGTAEVMGKTCEIYEIAKDTKCYVYNKRFPLKLENPALTMTATKFEENINYSDSNFDPPKDVKYTEY